MNDTSESLMSLRLKKKNYINRFSLFSKIAVVLLLFSYLLLLNIFAVIFSLFQFDSSSCSKDRLCIALMIESIIGWNL